MNQPPRTAATALVALVGLSGCGAGSDPTDAAAPGSCAFVVALDVQDPRGDFVQVGPASDARLILGFQGFKMVMARVRFDQPPAVSAGAMLVQLDGQAVRSQPLGGLHLVPDGSGDGGAGQASDPFPVFFNDDPLPALVNAGVAITLIIGDDRCGARASGHLKLLYTPGCIQDPDGGYVCGDGGS